MPGIEILSIAALGLAGLGALESLFHRARLRDIKTRIHVSGTRGKSSVTRLIAAGMRHGGISTAAKTTGTLARMILPDGMEVPIFRPAGANIIEQLRVVETARKLGAEALVLECMALQPELHWLSENKMIRATHGVITNVRADHLDVMGPTEADVGRALAGMIPVGGLLFTGEQKHLPILEAAAADRRTKLVCLSSEDLQAVTGDDLRKFAYVEHRENVALALKVLENLNVPREVALEGMWLARPDPGALTEHVVSFFDRKVVFINGFAANDPQSTETIWNLAIKRYKNVQKKIALFNLRSDRPGRTIQLARKTHFWHEADSVILMGNGAYLFARECAKVGIGPRRLVFADQGRVEDIFETVIAQCERDNLVVGMANIGGLGLSVVQYFKNRQLLL